MSKVSIIIPCRNETFLLPTGETTLQRTIREVHEKARGDYELIIVFDGKPFQYFDEYPKLITIYKYEPLGTRFSLNLAARKATGKYILKLDAHCKLAEGFDITLQEDMEDNWVVAPRMYALDYKTWEWQDNRFRDYFMLRCPFTVPRMFRFQAGADWKQRNEQRQDILIDENMKLHGSAFFMSKDFFLDKLGGLDILNENDVISFSGEETEISLKTWLGPWDGKVIVNKKTWYAHLHKGKEVPRGWHVSGKDIEHAYSYIANYWMGNKWEGRSKDLECLIERFMPIPSWSDNWKKLWKEWKENERNT